MIAAMLGLVGLAAIAYGWVGDLAAAIAAGFMLCLGALLLHELPVYRRVESASDDLAAVGRHPDPDLLDLSEIDWDWDTAHEDAA